MTLSSVVLPEPLGPISPRISPARTSMSTPASAATPSNRFVTPSPCRTVIVAVVSDGAGSAPALCGDVTRARAVPGISRRARSSISHRSSMPSGPQDQRHDDEQRDRELHRAGYAGKLPWADRDALLDPREGVGQERDDRRPRHRSCERRSPADHEHREQRERDREVELVRVERDHALGPQRPRRAHHRGAEQPPAVSRAHDARADRCRGERILPRGPQAKARTRFLVETADQQEQHGAYRRHAERGPAPGSRRGRATLACTWWRSGRTCAP